MWKIAQTAPSTTCADEERAPVEQARGAGSGEAQQRDQHEQQLAGEHVAEQPHRQRHGLGQQLHQVEQRSCGIHSSGFLPNGATSHSCA